MCGGTPPRRYGGHLAAGLSPRVRGNRVCGQRLPRYPGSIPACAGEPWQRMTTMTPSKVYPRVCGGTYPACRHRPLHLGLSPRVRGNRTRIGSQRYCPGSIPACAGEPDCHHPGHRAVWVYPRVCGGTPWTFDSAFAIVFAKGMAQHRLPAFYQTDNAAVQSATMPFTLWRRGAVNTRDVAGWWRYSVVKQPPHRPTASRPSYAR